MSRHVDEHVEEEEDLIESVSFFSPRIFEGYEQAHIPTGFEAVTLSIDGRLQADLDWKKVREKAYQAVEKGYALMWEMQLGLFEGLTLHHHTQFLTLTLSLEHFRDSLWKEFKSHTIGISLFRGLADFSQSFPWDPHQMQSLKEWLQERGESEKASWDFNQLRQHLEGRHLLRLFCRDVAIEYLSLLATRLPDSLPTYLYLDATSLASSLGSEMQLLNPERFERLRLALKGNQLPFEALGWNVPTVYGYSGISSVELPSVSPVSIGICIPPMAFDHLRYYQEFEEGLRALKERNLPFKLISENQLTSQWDGLDYLFYNPSGLSVQGKRKLQGFCAAGGTAVSTGVLLGLSHEIELRDFFIHQEKSCL